MPLISNIAWQALFYGTVSWFKPNNVTLVPNCPGLSLCLPLLFYMQGLYEVTLKSYNIVLQIGIIGRGYNGSWTFTQIHKLSVKKKKDFRFLVFFQTTLNKSLKPVQRAVDHLNFSQCLAHNLLTYLLNVWITELINGKWILKRNIGSLG